MDKDYYKILGVQEYESAEKIKAAYRKLARQWHPDIAGESEAVLKKFKEINEAYQVLSNSVKKEEYDKARRFYSYAKNGSAQNMKSENKETETRQKYHENPAGRKNSEEKGFSFNWEEFLSRQKMHKNFSKQEKPAAKKGADIYTDIEITFFESIEGCEKVINMVQTDTCPKCGGRKFINGALCKHCCGKGELSVHKKFTVKIPAGIKNNSKIRLAGEGADGLNGGSNGDLYINVRIKEPLNYKTNGLNILKTLSVYPYEAVLGAEIDITTINGTYKVKIPPNTQNGQKIRLANCGVVQNNKIGDMIITVEIRIPVNMSEEEKTLYRRLEALSKNSMRDSIYDR